MDIALTTWTRTRTRTRRVRFIAQRRTIARRADGLLSVCAPVSMLRKRQHAIGISTFCSSALFFAAICRTPGNRDITVTFSRRSDTHLSSRIDVTPTPCCSMSGVINASMLYRHRITHRRAALPPSLPPVCWTLCRAVRCPRWTAVTIGIAPHQCCCRAHTTYINKYPRCRGRRADGCRARRQSRAVIACFTRLGICLLPRTLLAHAWLYSHPLRRLITAAAGIQRFASLSLCCTRRITAQRALLRVRGSASTQRRGRRAHRKTTHRGNMFACRWWRQRCARNAS